jgi:hypothetical protein
MKSILEMHGFRLMGSLRQQSKSFLDGMIEADSHAMRNVLSRAIHMLMSGIASELNDSASAIVP